VHREKAADIVIGILNPEKPRGRFLRRVRGSSTGCRALPFPNISAAPNPLAPLTRVRSLFLLTFTPTAGANFIKRKPQNYLLAREKNIILLYT
jgi:hypothetical protein